jgi:hypothetical protein
MKLHLDTRYSLTLLTAIALSDLKVTIASSWNFKPISKIRSPQQTKEINSDMPHRSFSTM